MQESAHSVVLEPKQPSLLENSTWDRVVFCDPVHALGLRGGPPGPNHGPFTAKPSDHHLHSTLLVTPPTSPCPTLSADTEPACTSALRLSFLPSIWTYARKEESLVITQPQDQMVTWQFALFGGSFLYYYNTCSTLCLRSVSLFITVQV